MTFYYNICFTRFKYKWVNQFCSIGPLTNYTTVHCICTHLSFFTALFAVPPNTINPFEDIYLFLSIKDNPLVVVIVMCVFFLFLLLSIWAHVKDKDDLLRREILTLEDNFPGDTNEYIIAVFTGIRILAGSTANVGIQLVGATATSRPHILKSKERKVLAHNSDDWFLLKTSVHLGVIKHIHIWHDNSGSSPDWYCDKILVYDVKNLVVYTFFVEQWLSLEVTEFVEALIMPASQEEFMHLNRLVSSNIIIGLQHFHTIGNIFIRQATARFSRMDSIILLMTLITTGCLISIAFYKGTKNVQPGVDAPSYSFHTAEIIISIQTFIITVIIATFVQSIFIASYRDNENKIQDSTRILRGGKIMKYVASSHGFQSDNLTRAHTVSSKLGVSTSKRSCYGHFVRLIRIVFKPLPPLPITLQPQTEFIIEKTSRLHTLALFICVFFTIGSFFLVMLYGLVLGYEDSKMWLASFFLAGVEHIIIISPLKVIIISFILASYYKPLVSVSNYNIYLQITTVDDFVQINDNSYSYILQKREETMYKPFDVLKITTFKGERKRKQRIRAMLECLLLLIFMAALIILVKNYAKSQAMQQNIHVQSMILPKDNTKFTPFTKIYNRTHFESFLLETFGYSDQIYKAKWYNSFDMSLTENTPDSRFWAQDSVLRLIGPPILRQFRVIKGDCKVNVIFLNSSLVCIPVWRSQVEDTDDYGYCWSTRLRKEEEKEYESNPWTFTTPSKLDIPGFLGATGTSYPDGGYVAILSSKKGSSRLILLDLIVDGGWIDSLTRALFITFTLYNLNYNIYTRVRLVAEHLPFGFYVTRALTESVKIRAFDSFWGIILIPCLLFLLIRDSLRVNRIGIKSYLSKFVDIYNVFVLVLGTLSI